MGFLSEASYDSIRNDPSKVLDLYARTHEQFAALLDMPGLSQNAYIAAWCTVVAYDLVPYGPGPQTTDLNQILHADTIACAHYVSLAWQLIEQFGVSTDYETAMGWDDGFVGNHAQILFSDGTSNLLLDPTIGLIVNGVTLNGLLEGDHYSDYASFYSRNDITSFNQTVITGVTGGRYQTRDVIYSVPTLNNWLNHYSEYQGLTIDHPDGSKTIVGSLHDDALVGTALDDAIYGGKGNDKIDAGSGDDYVEGGKGNDIIDAGGDNDTIAFRFARSAYSVIDQGASGLVVTGQDGRDTLFNAEYLKFSDQILPLTARTVTVQDGNGNFAWTDNVTSFDADDRRISIRYDNDDGSHTVYSYDALDQFRWESVETQFDALWRKPQILYSNDDGSSAVYQYDIMRQYAWSRVLTEFDEAGAKSAIHYQNDDRTAVVYQYDVNGQFSWSQTARYFNAAGQKTADVYDNDIGTHTAYGYDPVTGAITSVHQFNAGWDFIA